MRKKSGKPSKLVGRRFGQLTVLRRMPSTTRFTMWACKCDCGQETITRSDRLLGGRAKSCGKGHANQPMLVRVALEEFRIWYGMHARCKANLKNYGARGIRVCKRWKHFENFLSDMGPRPSPQHSIDRFPDNDGNYEPTNCRWASRKQQNRNRRDVVKIIFRGEAVTVVELSERLGIDRRMVIRRLERGWSVEDAVTRPPHTHILRDDYPVAWYFGISTEPEKAN